MDEMARPQQSITVGALKTTAFKVGRAGRKCVCGCGWVGGCVCVRGCGCGCGWGGEVVKYLYNPMLVSEYSSIRLACEYLAYILNN